MFHDVPPSDSPSKNEKSVIIYSLMLFQTSVQFFLLLKEDILNNVDNQFEFSLTSIVWTKKITIGYQILQNIFFRVPQKKASHTDLNQHDSWVNEVSFVDELSRLIPDVERASPVFY